MKIGDKFILNNKVTIITNIFHESGGCWIFLDNGQEYGDEKDLELIAKYKEYIRNGCPY